MSATAPVSDTRGWLLAALAGFVATLIIAYSVPSGDKPSFFFQLILALIVAAVVPLLGLLRRRR